MQYKCGLHAAIAPINDDEYLMVLHLDDTTDEYKNCKRCLPKTEFTLHSKTLHVPQATYDTIYLPTYPPVFDSTDLNSHYDIDRRFLPGCWRISAVDLKTSKNEGNLSHWTSMAILHVDKFLDLAPKGIYTFGRYKSSSIIYAVDLKYMTTVVQNAKSNSDLILPDFSIVDSNYVLQRIRNKKLEFLSVMKR